MGSEDALTWAVAISDKVNNGILEKGLWSRYGISYLPTPIHYFYSSGKLKRWYLPEMCLPYSLCGNNMYRRAAP